MWEVSRAVQTFDGCPAHILYIGITFVSCGRFVKPHSNSFSVFSTNRSQSYG